MKIFTNKEIKNLFIAIFAVMTMFLLTLEIIVKILYKDFFMTLTDTNIIDIVIIGIFILMYCCVFGICYLYFYKQNKIMETAVSQIELYLKGDKTARIESDKEGEMYRLFHSVNTLVSVLNAHAANENMEKEFLKNTISDISHQLKTPLAALNIYNGLLQDEAENLPVIKNFATLSEHELERIEILVQNLLKITKLDAGTIVLEKSTENISDIMKDIELHFSYRAKQEQKEIVLNGADDIELFCDRDWLTEAVENIVKNALDHTQKGDTVSITWKHFTSIIQIVIKDNGSGIHPEDLPHIFKRFYRSRFSQDKQGIGLGLPLAKAIIEAHNGTIEVDSQLGVGTTFIINFSILTKL
jgi:signal transduction histidine kinase